MLTGHFLGSLCVFRRSRIAALQLGHTKKSKSPSAPWRFIAILTFRVWKHTGQLGAEPR
jgi:hypothetical protein